MCRPRDAYATGAIDVVVEMRWRASEVGDDEACVGALRSGLDAGEDTPDDGFGLRRPAVGGVVDLAVAAYLLRRRVQAPHRDVLGEIGGLAQQHAIAAETEDIAHAQPLADLDRLDTAPRVRPEAGPRAGSMTIAADQDRHARPAGTDAADDVAQHARHLCAVRGLTRAQEDRHRLAGTGFVDMDGAGSSGCRSGR